MCPLMVWYRHSNTPYSWGIEAQWWQKSGKRDLYLNGIISIQLLDQPTHIVANHDVIMVSTGEKIFPSACDHIILTVHRLRFYITVVANALVPPGPCAVSYTLWFMIHTGSVRYGYVSLVPEGVSVSSFLITLSYIALNIALVKLRDCGRVKHRPWYTTVCVMRCLF